MCIDVTLRGTFPSIASTISAIAVSLAIIIARYPVSKKLGSIGVMHLSYWHSFNGFRTDYAVRVFWIITAGLYSGLA